MGHAIRSEAATATAAAAGGKSASSGGGSPKKHSRLMEPTARSNRRNPGSSSAAKVAERSRVASLGRFRGGSDSPSPRVGGGGGKKLKRPEESQFKKNPAHHFGADKGFTAAGGKKHWAVDESGRRYLAEKVGHKAYSSAVEVRAALRLFVLFPGLLFWVGLFCLFEFRGHCFFF